jgi:hypothetical protein
MRVFVQSTLPCDADAGWERVQTSALLREICRPLIRLAPADGAAELPARWEHQSTVRLRSFMFGFIPLGVRTLRFEHIDHERREIQTREHDPLIRRWDHRIQFEPLGPDSSRYTDEVEVEAGLLTPVAWAFAQWFYRHRQRRWRRVARRIQNGAV